jgi:hypothetical protein
MTPSAEMSGQHETARQQSRADWGAVARGWYAQREELWKVSRPVGEWMVSLASTPSWSPRAAA